MPFTDSTRTAIVELDKAATAFERLAAKWIADELTAGKRGYKGRVLRYRQMVKRHRRAISLVSMMHNALYQAGL